MRIVDLLPLGDLAPRELQDRLGMPSNLVAHHLAVLQREGMISRRRSEADRRRSYVRLEPDGFEQLGPSSTAAAQRYPPDAAKRHGLDLPATPPQALEQVATDTDLVVTVCDAAHEELKTDALHWSIPDPVTIGIDAAFDAAFDEIARRGR